MAYKKDWLDEYFELYDEAVKKASTRSLTPEDLKSYEERAKALTKKGGAPWAEWSANWRDIAELNKEGVTE